jgi:hypothetical protein
MRGKAKTIARRGPWWLYVLVASTVYAAPARADFDEYALGLTLAGGYPAAGRALLTMDAGLTDWLGLRLEAGAELFACDKARPCLVSHQVGTQALAAAGLTATLDIFSWVPELFVGVGAAAGEQTFDGRWVTEVALRRYLDLDWSLTFGARLEWWPPDRVWVVGSIGIWWHGTD